MALSAPCTTMRIGRSSARSSLLRPAGFTPSVGRTIPLTRTKATPSGSNMSGKDIESLLKTSTKTDILEAAQNFEGEAAYREREGAGRALDATRQAVYPADNQPHGGQTPLPPKPRPMEWKESTPSAPAKVAAALPKAGAGLGAVKFILAAAAGAAVIQAITSTGVLTPAVRGFMHLVSYAIWLGSKAWVTLVSNPTLEATLADEEHGRVQSSLQVKQFALEAAALAVLLGTTLATGGAPAGQLYGIGALAISALLNMCFATPNKSGSDTVTGLLNWVGLGGGLYHGWWLVNAINSAIL